MFKDLKNNPSLFSRSIGYTRSCDRTSLDSKTCMECKECLAPNVMMTSLFFPLPTFFFKEEMVQRHETEQRNHGSRVPWVLAENWVMIDDRKNPHGISRSFEWGLGVA